MTSIRLSLPLVCRINRLANVRVVYTVCCGGINLAFFVCLLGRAKQAEDDLSSIRSEAVTNHQSLLDCKNRVSGNVCCS